MLHPCNSSAVSTISLIECLLCEYTRRQWSHSARCLPCQGSSTDTFVAYPSMALRNSRCRVASVRNWQAPIYGLYLRTSWSPWPIDLATLQPVNSPTQSHHAVSTAFFCTQKTGGLTPPKLRSATTVNLRVGLHSQPIAGHRTQAAYQGS